MILDIQAIFSDAQAITATAISTNTIDFGETQTPPVRSAPSVGQLRRDQGKGTPSPLLIQVVEDFDLLTDLTVEVQHSVDEAFTVPIVVDSQVFTLAQLVAGYMGNLQWYPLGADARYGRISYVVNGTDPTAGKITAGLTMGNQTNP